MEKTNNLNTRRNALQQMLTMSIGTGLLSLSSFESASQPLQQSRNSDPLSPFYLPPKAPLQIGSRGINLRTLIRSSQTNSQYSCVEFVVASKQMGPPPHIHQDLDEIMFVLEGTVTILVDKTLYEVQAGGWHLRPHGIIHTFWNGTTRPARYIDMYFNQNFEDFLEELNDKLIPDMERNQLTPSDLRIAKWWADLDKRFGITTFFDQRQPIIDQYRLKA
jgi:mannose-6-phosphate isomerase-like protein (cupin superfamily)